MKILKLLALTSLCFPALVLLCCSNIEENNQHPSGEFSEDEAQGLADLLQDSTENNNLSIVEEATIWEKSTYIDSIWKIVTRDLTICNKPEVRMSNEITFSYCDQGNGFELYTFQYMEREVCYTEKYLLSNNKLIYAVEGEKRPASVKDEEATWWNCEYIVQDDVVVDIMSLGMGKTEGKSFNVQDIITLWKSRMEEIPILKE